jgi:hypothetical protein
MNELLDIFKTARDAGLNPQNVQTVALVYLAWKVSRLDARLRAVCDTINACPTCRKHANIVPLVLVLLLAVPLMGCVKTSFHHGGTSIERTAFLTKIEVPSIEISTNGTCRASLKSDARTELIEALIRLIASAPK